MSQTREIHRYAAYFKGWCQTFGEHDTELMADESIGWLFGENQIDLVLPQELNKQLYRKVLEKTYENRSLLSVAKVLVAGILSTRFPNPVT